MAVGDAYVFPAFLTLVITRLSFKSHSLLFSHAFAEVRGKNKLERLFASTGDQTHNHQVMSPTCSPLSHLGGATLSWNVCSSSRNNDFSSCKKIFRHVSVKTICKQQFPEVHLVIFVLKCEEKIALLLFSTMFSKKTFLQKVFQTLERKNEIQTCSLILIYTILHAEIVVISDCQFQYYTQLADHQCSRLYIPTCSI